MISVFQRSVIPILSLSCLLRDDKFSKSECSSIEKQLQVEPKRVHKKVKKERKIKRWDRNWDMNDDKGSKVTHQVVLIRHGQYETAFNEDQDRHLTSLGKEQSTLSGIRLRELLDHKVIHSIKTVYYSTMIRATETYEQISPSLPPLQPHQIQACSMIREGAVCPPEPPSTNWDVTSEDFVIDGSRVGGNVCYYSVVL